MSRVGYANHEFGETFSSFCFTYNNMTFAYYPDETHRLSIKGILNINLNYETNEYQVFYDDNDITDKFVFTSTCNIYYSDCINKTLQFYWSSSLSVYEEHYEGAINSQHTINSFKIYSN